MKDVKYGKLKGFYVENGITYSEEAERLGISVSEFSQKINMPTRDFNLKQARAICLAHSLSMDDYFLHPVSRISNMEVESA